MTISSSLTNGTTVPSGGSGGGDVVGPASSVDNRVVFFDGTTGKLVKDSGLTLAGTNTGDQTSVTGNAGTATALQTPRNIDGQSFNGSADITVIAPGTVAAAAKATPVDADVMPLADSAAANVLKKVTWANVKATLKAYFDTLYPSGSGTSTGTNTGDQASIVGITGTLAQFNTALTGADFATGGGSATGTNTGDQTITLTGDATGSGAGSFAVNVGKINGVTFSGLATGLLKNTTGTGAPSIAAAGTDYVAPGGALGTPSSGTLTNCTGLPVGTGVSGLGAGVATFLATPTSANLAAALTTSTGTGFAVFRNSPAFITPDLGTPSAGTLTSCTGLPIATGVSGLAAGVAAFLAAPSSANMAAMVTDETGTGSNVFGTAPDITNLKALGNLYFQQGAPASKGAAATLTAAELLGGLIQYTGAAANLTLPTGTLMDAGALAGLAVDRAFEFIIINTSAATVTLAAGATFTIVGTATVLTGISARWRCRRTAANTWVAYRV